MIHDVLRLIHRLRWRLAAGFAAGCAIAVGAYISLPESYRADVVLAPVGDNADLTGNLAGMILGGLPDIRDISGSDISIAVFALTSGEAAREVLEHPRLMRALGFGASHWFPKIPWLAGAVEKLQSEDEPPTVMDVRRRLREVVETEEGDGGLVTVSLALPDREASVALIQMLTQFADDKLRAARHQRAAEQADYLDQLVQHTQVPQVRRNLSEALLQQISNRLMAESNLPFSFFLIDGPVADVRPHAPSLSKLLLISVVSIEILILFWVIVVTDGRTDQDQ